MSYNDSIGYILDNRPLFRGGVKAQTITGALTLTGKSEVFNIITNDAGSSVIVTLPELQDGAYQWIRCHDDSGHQLEIRDVATNTITYLTVGQMALFVCDGSNWHFVIKA